MNRDDDELRQPMAAEADRESRSIGEALFSLEAGLFVVGVLVSVILGYVLCSEHVTLSREIRIATICCYGVILVASWMGVSLAKYEDKQSDLPFFLLFSFFLLVPIGIMIFKGFGFGAAGVISFWVVLILWTLLALFLVLDNSDGDSWWEKMALSLGTIWATSGTIISLGLNPWIPYALEPTRELKSLHVLIDVRHLSVIGFGIVVTGVSLARTLANDSPRPKSLPSYQVPVPSAAASMSAVIISPFVSVFNILLFFIHALVDFLWRLIYIASMFFVRLGRQVGAVLREILSEREALWALAKLLSLFILGTGLTLLIQKASAPSLKYLTEVYWGDQFKPLSILIILVILMTLAMVGVLSLFRAIDKPPLVRAEIEDALQASVSGIATLLSNLLVSAGVLFAVSRIWFGDIQGFRRLGILATTLTVLVACGILRIIVASGRQSEK